MQGRLMSLLNDLLDLSKLEAGQIEYDMECHNLKKMFDDLILEYNTILAEKGISLQFENNDINADVVCDKLRIEQVIHNLLSNAIKFTQDSREILIFFKEDQLEIENEAGIINTCEGIRISVKDYGIGIPEDELDSVFEKFIQSSKTKTGAGGTGLGLSICREFVLAHNGKIWVENNPEGGTTFSFILPH
jgi:signal transduction histidine kinase